MANSLISWLKKSLSEIIDYKEDKTKAIEKLNHGLEAAREQVKEDEKELIKGLLHFANTSVKQIMKSRMDIMALEIDTDYQEVLTKVKQWGFSRIPVYRETIDKIEGILHIKDLLTHWDDKEFQWQSLLRPAYFIPEVKKIHELLKDFQLKHQHMAIVVDEYGGTAGLITLEDILEEIVGEINDEFDEEEVLYSKIDDNTYIFEGKISLNDFCKITGTPTELFEEVKKESESLGGLLLEINSNLPKMGDQIVFDKFVFTVEAVDNKRIKKVRVAIEVENEINKNQKSS
ncbi:MAG TPA: transporter associated domain-containing protein [Cytophagaceae bacterium]